MFRPANTYLGLQYLGLPGISRACLDGVMRLLQYGDRITNVNILSHGGMHCLLLKVNQGDLVAVRSGFGSGYQGEGPRTFAEVLLLLKTHGAKIEEIAVQQRILYRVDNSTLTKTDIETIENARPVRPIRWHDYIFDVYGFDAYEPYKNHRVLWNAFPPVIPFAIIDSRIIDLAINFWEKPDERLLTAYRRLEDIVRTRIGSLEHGQKLFSQAFAGPDSKLMWSDLNGAVQNGRANLFTGAFMAYRNPRAHRELLESPTQQLTEFLLLNNLYSLECSAEPRAQKD